MTSTTKLTPAYCDENTELQSGSKRKHYVIIGVMVLLIISTIIAFVLAYFLLKSPGNEFATDNHSISTVHGSLDDLLIIVIIVR